MIENIKIGDVDCEVIPNPSSARIAYIVYPAIVPIDREWLQQAAGRYTTNIVVILIPAKGWNDMLTPWPEPGETPDSPPFAGNAAETLKLITQEIIPQTDDMLNLKPDSSKTRNLIGVSLSALFAFWQWMICDTFDSISSLSGSFWYEGFMDWFEARKIPSKKGKAFFLLGQKEPHAWIRAYRTVGINTERIVAALKDAGVDTTFMWVPGDHFSDSLQRLELGLRAL